MPIARLRNLDRSAARHRFLAAPEAARNVQPGQWLGTTLFDFSVDEKAGGSKVALWPGADAHHQALTIWKNSWTVL
jgi:hypothetical protein